MKQFILLNIEGFKSLVLNLINYNNSKDGDNNIKSGERDYNFKIFKILNSNGEDAIIINIF